MAQFEIAAVVTDAFGGLGGIAQYNRDFIRAMAAHPRCRRVIVVPRVVGHDPGQLPTNVDHRLNGLGGVGAFGLACAQLTWTSSPQVILCNHVNLLPFGSMLKARFGVPLILMVYGIEVWSKPRWISRATIGMADRIVALSNFTIDRMESWAGPLHDRATIIPSSVDLERLHPRSERPDALVQRYGLKDRRVIMTLARLPSRERYKGVDEVIELLPSLIGEMPDLTYLVVGEGDDRPRLERKAERLGVRDRVVFTGFIRHEEKLAHYHLADAFVMPGRGEGFGIVYLEALAAGVPVVASELDGSKEAVLNGQLGELVNPLDPYSVRDGIRRALAKPRGVVPEGMDHFSLERFEASVRNMLDQMLLPTRHGAA